jgi:hypothetical protein
VRLHEGQHELPLFRGGLLSSGVRLEFSKDLLACRYLACRCTLSLNALGESELYLLRTLRALIVMWRPQEEKHEQGHRHQQNSLDSKEGASRPIIPDVLPTSSSAAAEGSLWHLSLSIQPSAWKRNSWR